MTFLHDTALLDPSAPTADLSAAPPVPVAHATANADWSAVYALRTYRAGDLAACRRLYRDGLLGGQIATNDTGLDIDDIEGAYLSSPGNHFWVAEVRPGQGDVAGANDGDVVGMIGVQQHDEGVGEIRRLRVAADHRRRRIGSRLLETAIRFCRDAGALKVALDTFIEREAAIALFDRLGFRHGRSRSMQGKEMLYFYLDLYAQGR